MASPSTGVNPIVVSIERPRATGERSARTQVAGDDPQAVGRPAEQVGGPARRVGVGEAVKAEPAQAVALAPFARQRVCRRGSRNARVERRIDAGDGRAGAASRR
jgi:hypothetical protein